MKDCIQISYISISIVTNIPTELVKRIINDIFYTLVEVSRKTNKEIHLHFKKTGYLYLLRNRELVFE